MSDDDRQLALLGELNGQVRALRREVAELKAMASPLRLSASVQCDGCRKAAGGEDEDPDAFLMTDDDVGLRRAVAAVTDDTETLGVRVTPYGAVFFHRSDECAGSVSVDPSICMTCGDILDDPDMPCQNGCDPILGWRLERWASDADELSVSCDLCGDPAEPGCGKNGIDNLCGKCADGLP